MRSKSVVYRFAAPAIAALAIALFSCIPARAQGLEANGGYSHVSGDFGMDGFTAGLGWWFAPRLSLEANYDAGWDTSRVGTFEFTQFGAIASKSHIQNFLVGPRYYFTEKKLDKRNRIVPFAEAQFGVSHLHQEVQQGPTPSITNSDSTFSWSLGGGVDYSFGPHWAARGEADLLRTHLNAEGQSRLRLGIGLVYTFGER